jgi:diacylglycerol kinase (ATP)
VSTTIGIIINPAAGPAWRRMSAAHVEAYTRAAVDRHAADAWVAYSKGPGHARELAHEAVANGARTVVAWGGDGTVNEVASAILYGRAVLGIVPVGSGNGLARELRIPANPDEALHVALAGDERSLDVGDVNGRPFFNVAGVGFDAYVAERFAMGPVRVRGLVSYAVTGFLEALRYRPHRFQVRGDGVDLADGPALLVSIANSSQWGNGARIAPAARLDDDRLDVVFVRARHPLAVGLNLWRLFWGDVSEARGVIHALVQQGTIHADPPAPLHVDGEPVGRHEAFTIGVRCRALRVRVPRGR